MLKRMCIVTLLVTILFPFDSFGNVWNFDNASQLKYYSPELGGEVPFVVSDKSMFYDSMPYKGSTGIDIYNFLAPYQSDAYNTVHMGFNWFGYTEIDSSFAVKGSSLKIVVTGGKTNSGPNGTIEQHGEALYNKEQFLKIANPYPATDIKVGCPNIYFKTSDLSTSVLTPIPEASNATKLSLYIYLPGKSSVTHDSTSRPARTLSIGTFTDLAYSNRGQHFYHDYWINGGGWIRLLVQTHPIHSNAGNNSPNNYWNSNPDFLKSLRRFYVVLEPYTGLDSPPFNTWIDEIEFLSDSVPQNNETIMNPAIGYYGNNTWEISLNTKYKCSEPGCVSSDFFTFETKYSFAPIDNQNYDNAEFCQIEATGAEEFNMRADTTGRFNKQAVGYPRAWARFRLKEADQSKIVSGTKIYFAIKDISSVDKYKKYPDSYQGAIDLAFVPGVNKNRNELVNLIDYRVPENILATSPVKIEVPKAPNNAKIN